MSAKDLWVSNGRGSAASMADGTLVVEAAPLVPALVQLVAATAMTQTTAERRRPATARQHQHVPSSLVRLSSVDGCGDSSAQAVIAEQDVGADSDDSRIR